MTKDLRPNNLRALDDRMSATLREMGVNFDIIRNDPWEDLPFQAAIFVRLSYDDPTLTAYTTRTAKLIGADPAKADFILDYVDGHFR